MLDAIKLIFVDMTIRRLQTSYHKMTLIHLCQIISIFIENHNIIALYAQCINIKCTVPGSGEHLTPFYHFEGLSIMPKIYNAQYASMNITFGT